MSQTLAFSHQFSTCRRFLCSILSLFYVSFLPTFFALLWSISTWPFMLPIYVLDFLVLSVLCCLPCSHSQWLHMSLLATAFPLSHFLTHVDRTLLLLHCFSATFHNAEIKTFMLRAEKNPSINDSFFAPFSLSSPHFHLPVLWSTSWYRYRI